MLSKNVQKITLFEDCTYLTLNPCVPDSVSVDVGEGHPIGPIIYE